MVLKRHEPESTMRQQSIRFTKDEKAAGDYGTGIIKIDAGSRQASELILRSSSSLQSCCYEASKMEQSSRRQVVVADTRHKGKKRRHIQKILRIC